MRTLLFPIILLLCAPHSGVCQLDEKENRILVLSGGGARGAYAAGLLNRLHEDAEYDYTAAFGTSTGSLIAPLALLDEHEKLKVLYTESKQKDILDRKIIKKNGKLKKFNIFLSILLGKRSVAGSQNLRKLLKENYTEADHERLLAMNKEFVVTTVSLETTHLEYRSSNDYDYDDIIDWIWASANQPVFMTPVRKTENIETVVLNEDCEVEDVEIKRLRQYWVDGGLKENIPLEKAVKFAMENERKNIDVIVLGNARIDTRLDYPSVKKKKFRIVDQLLRTLDAFSFEAARNDIEAGLYSGGARDLYINVYYIDPQFLNVSSLDFNTQQMMTMWEAGNNYNCKVDKYYVDSLGTPNRLQYSYREMVPLFRE